MASVDPTPKKTKKRSISALCRESPDSVLAKELAKKVRQKNMIDKKLKAKDKEHTEQIASLRNLEKDVGVAGVQASVLCMQLDSLRGDQSAVLAEIETSKKAIVDRIASSEANAAAANAVAPQLG